MISGLVAQRQRLPQRGRGHRIGEQFDLHNQLHPNTLNYNRRFPIMFGSSCGTGHFWSRSYFAASCGGAPLSVITKYPEQQIRPN
ncbi:transposase [Nocardia vinacea]|uniref:transposase n=1 Tax=Nocardia vinacea TaxID=96468 RepID=UPI0033EFE130